MRQELNDEQKRFLGIVYRSSERLQRLVGDLLFVARLDANGLQLHFGDAWLDEIVRDGVESSSALARAREVELVAEVEAVPPVSGDRERLSQLVANLISNALKFTPAGGRVVARAFVDGEVPSSRSGHRDRDPGRPSRIGSSSVSSARRLRRSRRYPARGSGW